MKTVITMEPRELDKMEAVADILKEYSRIYSATVYNKAGMHFDNAGTAAGILENIIKEQRALATA